MWYLAGLLALLGGLTVLAWVSGPRALALWGDLPWLRIPFALLLLAGVAYAITCAWRGRRTARETAMASQRRLAAIARSLSAGVFRYRLDDQRLVDVNPALAQMLGTEGAGALVGRPFGELFADPSAWEGFRRRLGEGGAIAGEETAFRTRSGDTLQVALSATPTTEGGVIYIDGVVTDITGLKRVRDASQLISILEAAPDYVAIADPDLSLRYLNAAGRRLFGYTDALALDRHSLLSRRPEWARAQLQFESVPHAIDEGIWSGETAVLDTTGREVPVSEVVISHRSEQGVDFLSAIGRDISSLKKYEAELRHRVLHDELTQVGNRVMLLEHLDDALARAERTGTSVAIVFIDLDNFKRINDTLGHHIGDEALKTIATRLRVGVRKTDLVARHGGDEFVVVLGDLQSEESTYELVMQLRAMVARPARLEGRVIYITFSAGVSLYPQDGTDAEALLKCADAAMYRAKGQGKNVTVFYSPESDRRGQEFLVLEEELRTALERREFELYYQPQLSLRDSRIVGVEALLRWRHPSRGLLAPAEFIGMLEETGLIDDVGRWVIHAACRQGATWVGEGLPPMRIAVNISARQFSRDDLLLRTVQEALGETGWPAPQLELELTESVLMQDVDRGTDILMQLSDMGVRVAIDDFGTGYSSLSYLKHFPIQSLKIDMSFIHNLPHARDDSAITQAVIAMGHSLGLEVVAEGVETDAQRAFLAALECEVNQGFFVGPPMPASEIPEFLRRRGLVKQVH